MSSHAVWRLDRGVARARRGRVQWRTSAGTRVRVRTGERTRASGCEAVEKVERAHEI